MGRMDCQMLPYTPHFIPLNLHNGNTEPGIYVLYYFVKWLYKVAAHAGTSNFRGLRSFWGQGIGLFFTRGKRFSRLTEFLFQFSQERKVSPRRFLPLFSFPFGRVFPSGRSSFPQTGSFSSSDSSSRGSSVDRVSF